jgi:hypothetical protein
VYAFRRRPKSTHPQRQAGPPSGAVDRGANVSSTLQFEIALFSDILTAPPSVEVLQIEEGGR